VIQSIINFITNNLFIVVLVMGGVFNVAVRLAQKAKEQRARKDAIAQIERQKQETLRTGRSTTQTAPVARAPVVRQPVSDPDTARKERIEALRQERMEQLRLLREQRAGAQSSVMPAGSRQSTSGRTLPGIVTQGPLRGSGQASGQVQPRKPQPQQRVQSTQTLAPRRRKPAEPRETVRDSDAQRVQALKNESAPVHQPQYNTVDQPAHHKLGSSKSKPLAGSPKAMLRSKASVRQAIVLREILDSPMALRGQGGLRDEDIASGSIL
jgi:hypothetical protein